MNAPQEEIKKLKRRLAKYRQERRELLRDTAVRIGQIIQRYESIDDYYEATTALGDISNARWTDETVAQVAGRMRDRAQAFFHRKGS